MRKLILAIILTAAVLLPLSASVTGGTRGLRTASTEHFDIIYQPESEETAALLYDNCEDIYSSLVEFFGTDPKLHIPVTVTKEFKTLNAYYTSFPANRIVIFDTISESGFLSVYPQTILYIFRHELTHGFQFNYRGPFINALSKVFGDPISLSPFLYMTKSLSEGGAVLSESTTGYGRINDSYSMQIVKQAKIEGLFPNYVEIAGARDTYPSGLLYYNFAACFMQYLSDTYGQENIATLWVRMGRPGFFESLSHMYRERTGKSIRELWLDFYDSIEVPEQTTQPTRTENTGTYLSPVLTADNKLYLYHGSTGAVVQAKQTEEETIETREILLNPTNEISMGISQDGTRLLIPNIQETSAEVRLYDLKTGKLLKRFQQAQEQSKEETENKKEEEIIDKNKTYIYRSGCFVQTEDAEYILLASNAGQRTRLSLIDQETYEPIEGKTVDLGYDVVASSLTPIAANQTAFILRYQGIDHIAVLDVDTMEIRILDNPDNIRFMSLSKGTDGDQKVLSFVWYPDDAKSTNLGRYGEITIETINDEKATVRLSQTDISGSMRECIRVNDEVIFTSYYYQERNLSTIKINELNTDQIETTFMFSKFDESMAPGIYTTALSEASRKYHSIKYFKDGILIPAADVTFGDGTSAFGLGVNWITMDPTETFQHTINAGWTQGSIGLSYTLDWTSSPIQQIRVSGLYGVNDKVEDAILPNGLMMLGAGADVNLLSWTFGNPNHYISIDDSYDFTFARNNKTGACAYDHSNVFTVLYSNARSTGSGLYETLGFAAQARLDMLDPSLTFAVQVPRLLWWRCTGRTVTNLPATFSFSTGYYLDKNYLQLVESVNVTLFSQEIQRGIYFMNLYSQRFTVKALYRTSQFFMLDENEMDFRHHLEVSANLLFTPVFGAYLSSLQFALNVTVQTDFMGVHGASVWFNGTGVTIAFGAYGV